MNSKVISALIVIAFVVACNESANQSTNSADSIVSPEADNTSVSPGTPDSAKNGMIDTTMNKVESLGRDKR